MAPAQKRPRDEPKVENEYDARALVLPRAKKCPKFWATSYLMAGVEEPRWTQQCPVQVEAVDVRIEKRTGGCRLLRALRRTTRKEKDVVVETRKRFREKVIFYTLPASKLAFLL